jgi:phosphoribosylformylglycinamidine (FGAM) synthase-like enzyme
MDLCPELGLTVPVGKDSMSMKSAWQEEGKNKYPVSTEANVANVLYITA